MRAFGRFLAGLVLAIQLLGGGFLAGESARLDQIAQLAAATTICHDDGAAAGEHSGAPAGGHHHTADCSLCCLCGAFAQTGILPAVTPPTPGPSRLVSRAAPLPPARAPPARVTTTAYPRGPPLLT